MTCKLEAEGPPLPARGQQLTQRQLSAGALGMLSILRQHWHFQECGLACLTCASISQTIGPWSLFTLDIVLPSWEENEHDS